MVKNTHWQIEKAELLDKLAQEEEKKIHKAKMNHKLDILEQKILNNMKNLWKYIHDHPYFAIYALPSFVKGPIFVSTRLLESITCLTVKEIL